MNTYFTYIVIVVICLIHNTISDERDHKYEHNEEVVLWMNTVGPNHNRQETYSYFSLPFCVGSKMRINQYESAKLIFSGLDIKFKANVGRTQYCEVGLNEEKLRAFIFAVKNDYWYRMFIDKMPIWGIVGEVDETDNSYHMWTHKKFDLGYNGNQIVDVNLTSEHKVKLELNKMLFSSYEVNWKKSSMKFEDRSGQMNYFDLDYNWISPIRTGLGLINKILRLLF